MYRNIDTLSLFKKYSIIKYFYQSIAIKVILPELERLSS